jgi:hypothetical protein
VRSLWTSLGWLGGAGKRVTALLTAVLTLASIAGFVITGALTWAALAIGVLLLLVGGLGWSLHDEYRKRLAREATDPKVALLEQAIEDGHALLQVEIALTQHREWNLWDDRITAMLREYWGVQAVADFDRALHTRGPRSRITAQIVVLEGLRVRPPARGATRGTPR